MAHRRVVGGGKEKAEAERVDRALDVLGRKLKLEPERLQDVGRSRG
jgi:hypothetical protein